MMKHDKVINGCESLAHHAGTKLYVTFEKPRDAWLIRFTAGDTILTISLETFVRNPGMMLDAFTDELVKNLK